VLLDGARGGAHCSGSGLPDDGGDGTALAGSWLARPPARNVFSLAVFNRKAIRERLMFDSLTPIVLRESARAERNQSLQPKALMRVRRMQRRR